MASQVRNSQKAYTYETTGSDVYYSAPRDDFYTTTSNDGYYTTPVYRNNSSSSSRSSSSGRHRYGSKQYISHHQNHVIGNHVGGSNHVSSHGNHNDHVSSHGKHKKLVSRGHHVSFNEGHDNDRTKSLGNHVSFHDNHISSHGNHISSHGNHVSSQGSHTSSLGRHVSSPSNQHINSNHSSESSHRYQTWHGSRQTNGIDAGRKLGVEPTLKATELSQPDVDELNIMAYAAGFHRARPASETFKTSFGGDTYASIDKTEWGLCAKIDLSRSTGLDKTPGGDTHKAVAEIPVTLHVRILDQQVSVEDISAQIESPGPPVPISLKALSTELVEVDFTPENEGVHKVSVRCRGEMVRGSPMRIKVIEDKSSYPKNVKVGGNVSAYLGEELQFQVDANDAGQGDIHVEISNAHAYLPVRITRDGRVFTVHTKAKEVGSFVVDIKWNGQSITDDPMRIAVRDPSKCRAVGDGLSRAREDTPATFTIDPSAAGPGELRVQVEGPNSMAKVSVDENKDGTYTVTYIPVEVGLFTLKIFWADHQIPGSPYHIKVTDPRKVRIVKGQGSMLGDTTTNGIIKMTVNKQFKIVFDTSEAGPGMMQADLDSPTSRIPLNVENEMQGRQSVFFEPDEQGDHELRVTWSGYPIKGSPLKLFSKSEEIPIDHTKVRIRGDGMEEGKVSKMTEFIIDGSKAGPGIPRVRMSGLHSDIDVKLVHQGNNVYKASYIPEKPAGSHLSHNGAYLLHLTWSDRQVIGSPFKVNIAGDIHADRVTAVGGALKMLVAHQTSRLVIDSRDAGSENLTARCMGPSQLAEVHIGDNQDGTYSLLITPKEQGRHVLEVKYGTEHIQGSPFVLRVAGAPDASQVRCFGPGLEHGMLSTFKGRFICETKGAGAGQLKVRVHGPKGAFRVEMKRNDHRDRTIDVRYDPHEVGDFTIHVKWSDKHVPGSPFLIKIVDSKEQLKEVQQKFPTHSSAARSRNGGAENGWSEDI